MTGTSLARIASVTYGLVLAGMAYFGALMLIPRFGISLPMVDIRGIGVLADGEVVVANGLWSTLEVFDRSGGLLYQRSYGRPPKGGFRLFVCNADSNFAVNASSPSGPDSTFIGTAVAGRVIVMGMPRVPGMVPGCKDTAPNVGALRWLLPHRLWLGSATVVFWIVGISVVTHLLVAGRRRALAWDDALRRNRGESDPSDEARLDA